MFESPLFFCCFFKWSPPLFGGGFSFDSFVRFARYVFEMMRIMEVMMMVGGSGIFVQRLDSPSNVTIHFFSTKFPPQSTLTDSWRTCQTQSCWSKIPSLSEWSATERIHLRLRFAFSTIPVEVISMVSKPSALASSNGVFILGQFGNFRIGHNRMCSCSVLVLIKNRTFYTFVHLYLTGLVFKRSILPETNSSPLKMGLPKRKQKSYSNHQFPAKHVSFKEAIYYIYIYFIYLYIYINFP